VGLFANLSQQLSTLLSQILVHFPGVFNEFADQIFGGLVSLFFGLADPTEKNPGKRN
jgi:hypothetical protein